jgi:hypothetical protein
MARGRAPNLALPPTRALTQQRDYRARRAARISYLEKTNRDLSEQVESLKRELADVKEGKGRDREVERVSFWIPIFYFFFSTIVGCYVKHDVNDTAFGGPFSFDKFDNPLITLYRLSMWSYLPHPTLPTDHSQVEKMKNHQLLLVRYHILNLLHQLREWSTRTVKGRGKERCMRRRGIVMMMMMMMSEMMMGFQRSKEKQWKEINVVEVLKQRKIVVHLEDQRNLQPMKQSGNERH